MSTQTASTHDKLDMDVNPADLSRSSVEFIPGRY